MPTGHNSDIFKHNFIRELNKSATYTATAMVAGSDTFRMCVS